MASIEINTGRKEIEIVRNGENVGSIWFSPADVGIIKRMREAAERVKAVSMEISESSTVEESIAEMDRIDGIIREAVDYAFAYPCADVVFGDGYSFTASDGVSELEQFLDGALAIIEKAMPEEAAKAKARQDKYLAKYRK